MSDQDGAAQYDRIKKLKNDIWAALNAGETYEVADADRDLMPYVLDAYAAWQMAENLPDKVKDSASRVGVSFGAGFEAKIRELVAAGKMEEAQRLILDALKEQFDK